MTQSDCPLCRFDQQSEPTEEDVERAEADKDDLAIDDWKLDGKK